MQNFLIEDTSNNVLYYLVGVQKVSGATEATITQYSTPSGKRITDNFYVNPRNVSFELITSAIAMSQQKRVSSNSNVEYIMTIQDLKDLFRGWINSGTRVNITTFENYYPNMVMSALREDEGGALRQWTPSLSFTEVRIANAKIVKLEFPENAQEKADSDEETNLGANNGSVASTIGSVVGSTGAGAAAGALIGSVIPGIGTGVGAVIGGVFGFITGLLG